VRKTSGLLVVLAALALGARSGLAAPQSSACVEDDPIPTPAGYAGWERSPEVTWTEIEANGGIVPDINEDPTHAPPAWWRYPSPLRSAALVDAETKKPRGLYEAVPPGDLKKGDLLIRTRGAGPCGKMTMIAGTLDDGWVTVEAGDGETPATRPNDPIFFDGKRLRPEVAAYRIRVKKDSSLGHVRELERDLGHLERTISERPPLVAKKGAGVVDEKVHDLIDEAWSLGADPAFGEDRRALTGRALALAAALDWPAASEEAAAVLDGVLRKTPLRADAILARANVYLLAGDAEKAITLTEAAKAIPEVPPRVHYLLARALLAAGKQADGLAELRRYRETYPYDALAARLGEEARAGKPVPLVPAPKPADDATRPRLTATEEGASLVSDAYDFTISWPLSWRIDNLSSSPETGLLIDFATGRVLREDGEAERATAVVLAQRPAGNGAAGALAHKGARNIFPTAKLKTLPPLIPGSTREQFRERAQGANHLGEVTTVQRNGVVTFIVLNATVASYPKLKDEYAAVVKSFAPGKAPRR
jgi:tetratricopeptide (TPR) repeat protein